MQPLAWSRHASESGTLTGLVAISLAVICGCQFLPWNAAHAARLEPAAKTCNLYFRSTLVFIGKVTTATPFLNTEGDTDGWIYTLDVIKLYRGVPRQTVSVYTENDAGQLVLRAGQKYLLFATAHPRQLFSINDDGLSGAIADAGPILAELDKLAAATSISLPAGAMTPATAQAAVTPAVITHPSNRVGGDIYGRIVYYNAQGRETTLAGIRLSITGGKQYFQTLTDQSGWFHLHVPAGVYSAHATDAKWTFQPHPLSWDNPARFKVPDSGCAEIQLQAEPQS